MPPKPTPAAPKKKGGRPRNAERSVEITLKVAPSYARFLTALGVRHGYGKGHTAVARFLLEREVARVEELEATNPAFRDGQG
jgi:hypothetical protein